MIKYIPGNQEMENVSVERAPPTVWTPSTVYADVESFKCGGN